MVVRTGPLQRQSTKELMLLNCSTREDSFKNPLDSKEIKPVNLKRNQSWILIGRTDAEVETPIFWPPDAKSWLIGKDPDPGKDWTQKEKSTIEDEMLDSITDVDMNLGKLQEMLRARKAWCAVVHGGHKDLDMTWWLNNNSAFVANKKI